MTTEKTTWAKCQTLAEKLKAQAMQRGQQPAQPQSKPTEETK